MKFNFGGDSFRLEFHRERKQIRSGWNATKNEPVYKPSRYAYTTFTLLKDVKDALPGIVVRTYTVGCHNKDAYSKEGGRRAAIEMALYDHEDTVESQRLTKPFRKAVWDAYWLRSEENHGYSN